MPLPEGFDEEEGGKAEEEDGDVARAGGGGAGGVGGVTFVRALPPACRERGASILSMVAQVGGSSP